jgi:hypothetical protein
MSSRVPLRGGSAGEPVKGGQLPYFHDGVKATRLISKNTYGLRLLPAFEYDYNNMVPKSPLSWVPYRDKDKVDPETQRPVFTDWYFPLKIHEWVGQGERGYVSPLLVEGKDCKDADPLHNIWMLARHSENPDWQNLTEKPDDEYNAVLRRYRVYYVVNALLSQDNKMENRLIMVTNETLSQLKKKLNQRGGRGDPILDPNWEDYCFGDVTSPQHGLFATVKPGQFNDAGMKTSLFYFGNQPQDDRPIGVHPYPIDINQEWGQLMLSNRYNIADTEKVTKIANPDEMLAYIVEDDYLPYALVYEACAHRWTVPAQSTHRKTFVPPPVAQSPTLQHDQASPPVPPISNRKFWMMMGGQVKGPFAESAIAAMVMTQRQDIQVVLDGTQEWKPTSAFGIKPPAAQAAPAAPPVAPSAAPSPPLTPPPLPASSSAAPVVLAPTGAPPAAPVVTSTPPAAASTAPPPPAAAPGPPSVPTATGMPPRPPGPPGGTRPAPAQPNLTAPPAPAAASSAGPPPPLTTSAPAAQPLSAPGPAVPSREPLNATEMAEYKDLLSKWTANGGAGAELLTPEVIARFSDLSDRISANNQSVNG